MRNHVIFKFLAIALCALCLMGAIVSGGSLVVLAGLGLQDGQSPREKWRSDLEDNLRWQARNYVARYAAQAEGKADQAFVNRRYSEPAYDYQIKDSKDNVVAESITMTGDFTEFVYTVNAGTVNYEFPVSEGVTSKFLDREEIQEQLMEKYQTEYPDEELQIPSFWVSDDTSIFYVVQEQPTKQDYTVVFHIANSGLGGTQADRLWSMADAVWRHELEVSVALGVCLVLFAALAVYLCMAAGRKPGSEEIRPGGLNCIPLDIYLAAVVLGAFGYVFCAAEGLGYFIQQSMLIFLSIYGYGLYAWCLLCVGFCFACAAQFKTPNFYWWRRSVTGLEVPGLGL